MVHDISYAHVTKTKQQQQRKVRLSHDKSPEEAGLLESRGALSSSALASSNGRSSNASRGATNRLLELSIGEHRPDRVANCNESREKPKLAVRVEIVRVLEVGRRTAKY